MELKLQIHTIITDESTGEAKIVKTVRTAEEIVGSLEETEQYALSDSACRN